MAVKRVREKARRARAKSAMQWAEERRHHPAHRREIEAILAEIDLRQDRFDLAAVRGMVAPFLRPLHCRLRPRPPRLLPHALHRHR
ncbi:MAG: hypothetical protein HYS37_08395 [Candidatus Rokubacteria bacterium]|nr:hypothetical protein [Candidatus Rokubacteria bacterium]